MRTPLIHMFEQPGWFSFHFPVNTGTGVSSAMGQPDISYSIISVLPEVYVLCVTVCVKNS